MRRVRALSASALLAIAACATTLQAHAQAPLVDRARIDAALQSLIDDGTVVGASALVFERGREAYFNALGFADREAEKPMTRDTLVQIFSMTKPVTGVALMMLYEENRFELDDPLARHAPEFANLRVYAGVDASGAPKFEPLKRPVTLRDLMRHTAGLTSGNNDPTPVRGLFLRANPMSNRNTLAQMARQLGKVPLAYQPGTRWLYSPAVDVQAFLVERLSGQPFDQFLQRRIFEPLRMTQTHYVVPEQDRARLAALYERDAQGVLSRVPDEEAFEFNLHDWPMKPGGWGLVSTLDDYARFARMLLNGGELEGVRILKPETVRLMTTNALPPVTDRHFLPTKGQVGFGIDFAVRIAPPASPQESSGEVGEFFWDGSASTLFWVDPENQIAAVFFTQRRPCCAGHKVFRDAVYFSDETASSQRSSLARPVRTDSASESSGR